MLRSLTAPAALVSLLVLAGCAREGDILPTGIIASYNACPPTAIPAPAGDITLFSTEGSRDAASIDVVATITNLRGNCHDNGGRLVTNATFDIVALRSDARGARDVDLPYFATVVQGGTNVVSKRTGRVRVRFEDGSYRGQVATTALVLVPAASDDRAERQAADAIFDRLEAATRAIFPNADDLYARFEEVAEWRTATLAMMRR